MLIAKYHFNTFAVVIGGVCMLGMLVDMIIHTHKHSKSWFARAFCTCKSGKGKTSRWRSIMIRFVRALVELSILFISIMLFAYLVYLAQKTDVKKWGFGQIIAITIWIPVMLEYFHALYRGLEHSMGYRIPPGFQLCPKPSFELLGDIHAFTTNYDD